MMQGDAQELLRDEGVKTAYLGIRQVARSATARLIPFVRHSARRTGRPRGI
jgi:hypothetical protein